MNGFLPRRSARTMLAVLGAMVLAGCSHKITQTDPGYTRVEGVTNADARMVTVVQGPTWGYALNDGPTFNDITDDEFKAPVDLSPGIAGRVHLQIIDRTPASGFDLFRTDPGGGYRKLLDYTLLSTVKWLDTNWELYHYVDTQPVASPTTDYVGRGLLQGVSGEASPLTAATPSLGNEVRQTLHFQLSNRLLADSTMRLIWTTDARAAGYWIQVMPYGQMDGKSSLLERAEGLPILESVGAKTPLTGYLQTGGGTPTATWLSGAGVADIINDTPGEIGLLAHLHKNQIYFLRVVAVDAEGRVINQLQCDYRVFYTGANDTVVGPGGRPVTAPVYVLQPTGGVVFGSFSVVSGEKPPIDLDHDFRLWERSGIPGH